MGCCKERQCQLLPFIASSLHRWAREVLSVWVCVLLHLHSPPLTAESGIGEPGGSKNQNGFFATTVMCSPSLGCAGGGNHKGQRLTKAHQVCRAPVCWWASSAPGSKQSSRQSRWGRMESKMTFFSFFFFLFHILWKWLATRAWVRVRGWVSVWIGFWGWSSRASLKFCFSGV